MAQAVGRPLKEIDPDQFEKLCALQCTSEEICSFFGCSDDTLNRWCKRTYKHNFAEVSKQKGGNGRISLRRSQFRLAETNAAMAIFLGKQYLRQSDNPDQPDKIDAKVDIIISELTRQAAKQSDDDKPQTE